VPFHKPFRPSPQTEVELCWYVALVGCSYNTLGNISDKVNSMRCTASAI
jgi:hypothetical protein